ncbi:dihydroorotase [Schleiferia thermophila]|jgi:dihydroorotase|uniref:Dihydroorotase n=1 Tax=Schleiferia thermophila TaxID=884107 RepID=A0A369ACX6_9FLAO|nr:dihydroorotase [Schleiferia thermophila]KFD40216.1 hypothetical protein AT05_00175 [Schleiferia thermophila str. Yellowstone]RCX05274.1 dihydroorotase [Schleiferia thermophila]GCD79216.1 dihydroorotase [Schleiferia thermophila]
MSAPNVNFSDVYNLIPGHEHYGKICNISLTDKFLEIKPVTDHLHLSEDTTPGGKLILAPGFIDMHSEINEPGREDRETLSQTIELAIKGGYIAVAAMPSAQPVIDHKAFVDFLKKSTVGAVCEILPVGAVTKELKGNELSEMFDMKMASAIAFSDYKCRHRNTKLLMLAMQYARQMDMPIMISAGDVDLMKFGSVHEGNNAVKLGLKSIPSIAESIGLKRDIELVKYTGCKVHFQSISTIEGIELIRRAKNEGLPVTADVNFYHLLLNDEYLHTFDSNYKTDPPLRDEETRLALIDAVKDGTIDAIAADHQPRTYEEKVCEFDRAQYGMFTLPFVFGTLWNSNYFTIRMLIEKLHQSPKKILNLPAHISEKYLLLDLEKKYTIKADDFNWFSCTNSPFFSYEIKGKIEYIISENICEKIS